MKTALIVRADKSGLGQGQTKRLARLIKPDRVIIIDSTPFNQAQQYPEWYKDYDSVLVYGFPTDQQVKAYITDIDVLISCELFYNINTTAICKKAGVKTILIANPEFLDWYKPEYATIPPPDKIIVPSEWKLKELQDRFRVEYIPTPIFKDEFKSVDNLTNTGKKRYLFINGKSAIHDRNGLDSLYGALPLSKGDYEIVIKSQHGIKKHPDPRITYDTSNPDDQAELYNGYDALILPRRYAGQSLPMCEALICALPVVMTDVDPNNKVLPKQWLVPAIKSGQFMTRTLVDIYSADIYALAQKLDIIDTGREAKITAQFIGQQYEATNLKSKYKDLLLKW